jgi:hypothetical protein
MSGLSGFFSIHIFIIAGGAELMGQPDVIAREGFIRFLGLT